MSKFDTTSHFNLLYYVKISRKKRIYVLLGKVSKKKEKKSREFSLTGGAGSPPFPTYFIFDFVKQLVK